MEFVQARWFHPGRLKPIRLIVIHCTVSGESPTGAESVARYFATTDRHASAHRVADNNSTVACVRDFDTAFGAAGANADGLHLELVGRPEQSSVEWLDAYSRAELKEAGVTTREWAKSHGIPRRWLTIEEVADGVTRGFCTHADVSRAFPAVSTGHWDPGPNFPKATAMALWFAPPPLPLIEDDMAYTLISPNGFTWLVEPTIMTLVPEEDKDNVAKRPALGKVSDPFFKRIDAGHKRIEV